MIDQERIAVLEANQDRLQKDVQELFKLMREHMVIEEARWERIQTNLSKMAEERSKERSFVGGIIFAASAFWTVVTIVLTFWMKTRHGT